ncbi:MAG: hypothetical protein ABIA47_01115 [bacterium]
MNHLILGLIGPMYAGTTTVAKWLHDQHGAIVFRHSDILRSTLEAFKIPLVRKNYSDLVQHLVARHGEDILYRGIAEAVSRFIVDSSLADRRAIVVLDSIRIPGELELWHERPDFESLCIDAPFEARLDRARKMNRFAGDCTMSARDFRLLHKIWSERQGAKSCLEADAVITNDSSVEDLVEKVRGRLLALGREL